MTPGDIAALQKAYASGAARPSDVVDAIYARLGAAPGNPAFISLVPLEQCLDAAKQLERRDPSMLPLYGIPFAVKDNIDVAGMDTTAGCPAFAYRPKESATCVQKLIDAGALLIGKTNLDQFATGLVGTRSPYGVCWSTFDERYISGGSSSGSAVAVADAMVTFALGTDTAGSGRVPAAFNNIIGLKTTRGRISASGVVPACRTLDCVSVFSMTAADAGLVLQVLEGQDVRDPYSRQRSPGDGATPWAGGPFRFGVPRPDQLEFFGFEEGPELFAAAETELKRIGGAAVEIDLTPWLEAARLLYSGPWVAERHAAVGEFLAAHPDAGDSTVTTIIMGAAKISAVQAFEGLYRLQTLRAAVDQQWSTIDFMVLPTAPRTYTIEEVKHDPVRLNTNLGYYTNFVNLLDLAAVATPAGFDLRGLPFGVSLIGPAFTDEALLLVADGLHRRMVENIGATQYDLDTAPVLAVPATPSGCILVAVVGAHLHGEPLNWQLTSRQARLVRRCRTAAGYRLYALTGTVPLKPGLVREPGFDGPGIEVEVWAVPEDRFGSFVAEIPPPLGIGTVTLEDGTAVKCFLCEPAALQSATEITSFAGWRGYLQHRAATAAH
ncbi:MAG TPA: allophanate hydrolase [Bryobacteraceae bacterium]|nr:allophanate hydrolase [Bryobacteraceae bacterium]